MYFQDLYTNRVHIIQWCWWSGKFWRFYLTLTLPPGKFSLELRYPIEIIGRKYYFPLYLHMCIFYSRDSKDLFINTENTKTLFRKVR